MSKLPNIVLTDEQEQCVDSVHAWYKNPMANQVFFLAGNAGTGKTTLIVFILEKLGIKVEDCAFATYTGKAALVLSKKNNVSCSTVHGLCYELVEDYLDDHTNQVVMKWKIKKDSKAAKAKLIILDEVSMLNKAMMSDLMYYKCKILALGDTFQLAPVEGDCFFHANYKPDFELKTIHRQALENPIIWLSQQVRYGRDIGNGKYGDTVQRLSITDMTNEMLFDADQVIVGTNATRRQYNKFFRDELGLSKKGLMPVRGDRLICLKNQVSDGLVNGMMMVATRDSTTVEHKEIYRCSFNTEDGGTFFDVKCAGADILGHKSTLPYIRQKALTRIDYSYAITCHKSQGSQYGHVAFVDEGFGRWLDDNTYYRHLYTAITRAAETLTIIAAK